MSAVNAPSPLSHQFGVLAAALWTGLVGLGHKIFAAAQTLAVSGQVGELGLAPAPDFLHLLEYSGRRLDLWLHVSPFRLSCSVALGSLARLALSVTSQTLARLIFSVA
ncbi:hypothetical protein ES708_29525 [subsurface metagenome]